ncbi:MAG: hypothetical protein ACRDGD_11075 [Candidatus Limnocylindria bacterium]
MTDRTVDPERAGLVWIDAQRAVITRWQDEPVLERLESGVPPRRRAMGSVRRGPARPEGGGRVGGQGTEGRHVELTRRFFGEVAERVAELDFIEVSGRAQVHERFAEVLRRLVERGDGVPEVTTRSLSRRPSDRQMAARLRKIVGEQLPRHQSGPFRPLPLERTASGRVREPGRSGFRNPTRRHLPEREHIDREIEMMLEDDLPGR